LPLLLTFLAFLKSLLLRPNHVKESWALNVNELANDNWTVKAQFALLQRCKVLYDRSLFVSAQLVKGFSQSVAPTVVGRARGNDLNEPEASLLEGFRY
jgi:hypothetical protein